MKPTTVLQRVAELDVRVTAMGDVHVMTAEGPVSGGPHCLAILDLFSQPASLAEALEQLGGRTAGAQDWIDLTAAVARLHDAGILRAEGEPEGTSHNVLRSSFDSPSPHTSMLEDQVRTSAFLAALDEVVRSEDVVLDIGTGTGVLAVGAARADARHVYAIEATPLAHEAREVVRANGFEEKVTIVEGWSTRVSLPERATVVVSEILGSDALEERILPVLADARRRLLVPDARLIPSAVRIFGLPVAVPDERVDSLTFTTANTARWSSWYGLELAPLADYSARLRQRFTTVIDEVRSWTALSEPVLLAELDLTKLEAPQVDVTVSGLATSSGAANGAIAFFEAQLSPGVVLSTNPALDPAPISWGVPVWLLPEPLRLQEGQEFSLEYAFGGGGGRLRLVA
ncbi:MAG: 50S ribosomal protein L11 methyltransferase [Actinomycetota bacterium]